MSYRTQNVLACILVLTVFVLSALGV